MAVGNAASAPPLDEICYFHAIESVRQVAVISLLGPRLPKTLTGLEKYCPIIPITTSLQEGTIQ